MKKGVGTGSEKYYGKGRFASAFLRLGVRESQG